MGRTYAPGNGFLTFYDPQPKDREEVQAYMDSPEGRGDYQRHGLVALQISGSSFGKDAWLLMRETSRVSADTLRIAAGEGKFHTCRYTHNGEGDDPWGLRLWAQNDDPEVIEVLGKEHEIKNYGIVGAAAVFLANEAEITRVEAENGFVRPQDKNPLRCWAYVETDITIEVPLRLSHVVRTGSWCGSREEVHKKLAKAVDETFGLPPGTTYASEAIELDLIQVVQNDAGRRGKEAP